MSDNPVVAYFFSATLSIAFRLCTFRVVSCRIVKTD